jgi:hypothetical protein
VGRILLPENPLRTSELTIGTTTGIIAPSTSFHTLIKMEFSTKLVG